MDPKVKPRWFILEYLFYEQSESPARKIGKQPPGGYNSEEEAEENLKKLTSIRGVYYEIKKLFC